MDDDAGGGWGAALWNKKDYSAGGGWDASPWKKEDDDAGGSGWTKEIDDSAGGVGRRTWTTVLVVAGCCAVEEEGLQRCWWLGCFAVEEGGRRRWWLGLDEGGRRQRWWYLGGCWLEEEVGRPFNCNSERSALLICFEEYVAVCVHVNLC